MSTTRRLAAVLAPFALAATIPAGASAATAFYGVTADNHLVEFQSDNTTSVPAKPLRGLQADERIVGLDLRPADLRLYALTNKNRFVVINPRNGGVRYLGDKALEPAVTGDAVGFDFNPVADAIRVETNAGQNLRIEPSTGQLVPRTVTPSPTATPEAPATPGPSPSPTTAPGVADGALQYAAGDAGAGTAPKVTASAYTNAFPIGTTTTLFALDAAKNALVRQDPPNDGTLRTVGPLGTTGAPIAFDIAEQNAGYAAITTTAGGTRVGLYRVNLDTGTATPTGGNFVIQTKSPIVGLAAAGDVDADKTAPGLSVSSSSTQLRSRLLEGGLQLTVNCDEACSGTVRVKYAGHTAGTAETTVERGAGYDRVAVNLDSRARAAIRSSRGARLDLRVEVADGAGNRSDLSRPIRSR
ncbi:MAG: DUF4394 domain-containing protein [Solirubrobacteraceae bacterium]|nr:DUF4394 domain-containing protein [Solirubrobacteraceae bacterium]